MGETKGMIEVRGLIKKNNNFALKDVSFFINPGQVCGLIGNNGAGKTTLLKSIMNMVDYDGQIYIDGKLLLQNDVEFRRHIGYVGDFDLAYREIKLRDIYNFTKGIHGKNWDDVRFNHLVKDLFALDMDDKILALSTGMKKKFWLALALAHNPKILLLDEPTTGLDPSARDEIMGFIFNLVNSKQTSVLFSTHIIDDLEMIAHRVMVIEAGQITFDDSKTVFLSKGEQKNVNRINKKRHIIFP